MDERARRTESGMNGCPCLEPKWAAGAEEPDTLDREGRDNGRLAVVEGRFTGESSKGGAYTLHGFEVLRHRPFHDGDKSEAKVIATAAQLAEGGAALADDKPWIATVDSFDVFDKASEKKVSALTAKVKAAGFEPAVLDSRTARLLFCCYSVVIAGRFATQDEATAKMKELKKKGFANAGVRRGW